MKRKSILYFVILTLFLACEEDKINVNPTVNDDSGITKSEYTPALTNPNVKKGIIRVKLSKKIGDKISLTTQNSIVQSNVTPLNTLLSNIKATGMKRLFPYAGKFEERTRREGLHLWYVVKFDENVLVANALSEANRLKDIETVEEVYQLNLPDTKVVEAKEVPMAEDEKPFDDPYLSKQWHYQNFGKISNSKKGADINLFKAWKEETGKSNVIVCIVDGGVDFTHEDLKDNMHINLKEKNGQEGVDDDNNGYIDDIYGYNFVTNTAEIIPDAVGHGTHVAGTVAARNNNGKGVCGVAGGNGTPESGVRLISAQIFLGERGGDSAAAIKYGADNGAVISQNSWGYPYPGPGYILPSEKAAIDYFIKYAGCDNDGNQLPDSPMKGGIAIFAAGNDGKEFFSVPAAYEPTVAVTSMAPNFERAYYSNYGTWADIMAPGGDDRFYYRGTIYSTLPNNRYGYMQGTSMACPHVSGVAALIVSKFGKQGFTNTELRKRLLSGLRPFNIDKNNPNYVGKLGIGYIDAYAVLAEEGNNKAPETPNFTEIITDFTSLEIQWEAVKDENDGTPVAYNLYYSDKKEELNESNYKNAEKIQVSGVGYQVGETVSYLLKDLPLNTKYSFALEAVDRWGAISGVAFKSAKTKENHAPIITRETETPIRIRDNQTATLKLMVNEPDGQEWTHKVSGYKRGVSSERVDDGVLLSFSVEEPLGKYSLKVTVKDVFNAAAEIEIPFEYYRDEPPVLSKEFGKVYAPVNKVYTIDLNKHFTDPEGKKMTFTATSSASAVGVNVNDNILSIKPTRFGMGSIEVIAKDAADKTAKATFELQVVNDELVYLMYPVPVRKMLNVLLSNEVNSATLKVRTLTGKIVLEKNVKVSDGNRKVALNLSKVSGGTYVLVAEANGETFEKTFVKY